VHLEGEPGVLRDEVVQRFDALRLLAVCRRQHHHERAFLLSDARFFPAASGQNEQRRERRERGDRVATSDADHVGADPNTVALPEPHPSSPRVSKNRTPSTKKSTPAARRIQSGDT
jgi:hypothetical protein